MTQQRILVTGSFSTKSSGISDPEIRKLHNELHTVLPCTMMVEGNYVPNVTGSTRPTKLHFSARHLRNSVPTWNGRVVSINHPDQSDTCNTPEVFNKQGIGVLYNTRYEEDKKALKADLWINNERGKAITNRVKMGECIDVSIGALGELVPPDKSDLGYDYVFSNIVGDHLAVLPDGTGACSWRDGAGIRASVFAVSADEPPVKEEEVKATSFEAPESVTATINIDKEGDNMTERTEVARKPDYFDEEEYLKKAPPEFRRKVLQAMDNDRRIREKHVTAIMAFKDVRFDEKSLDNASTRLLEDISALIDVNSRVIAQAKENQERAAVKAEQDRKDKTTYGLRTAAAAGTTSVSAQELGYAPFENKKKEKLSAYQWRAAQMAATGGVI